MRTLISAGFLLAMAAMPIAANAQGGAAKSDNVVNCPMMANSAAMQKDMQKDMAAAAVDMKEMMAAMNDPAMKARMEKMHDRMTAMATKMQKMNGGAMGMMKKSGLETGREKNAD